MVLGQFRTRILDEKSKGGILGPTGISDYDTIKANMADRHKKTHGKQPGNPELAAKRVLDIARLENLTETEKNNLPLRIPLGIDALGIMRSKCTKTLEHLQVWETFARSTDFADAAALPSYHR